MFKYIACVLFIFMAGVSEASVTEERMDNVVRVFWHQSVSYSVLVDVGNNTYRMKNLPAFACDRDSYEVALVSDVGLSNKMWASWKIKPGLWGDPECLLEMTIHIHSPKDIGEGSWTCGKSTCQTSVIE